MRLCITVTAISLPTFISWIKHLKKRTKALSKF